MPRKKVSINLPDTIDAFYTNVEYIQGATNVFTECGFFTKKLLDVMKEVYNELNGKNITVSVIQHFFKTWTNDLLKNTETEYILLQIKRSKKYQEALLIVKTKKDLKQLKREISIATTFEEIEKAIERYKLFNKKTFAPKKGDLILIGD
jgi:hypothetical protein